MDVEAAVASTRMKAPAGMWAGGMIVLALVLVALLAPWLGTVDPGAVDPAIRNAMPGERVTMRLQGGSTEIRMALMGTDALGRDLCSRTLYGTRISLLVGFSVAAWSGAIGLAIGLVAGYVRWFDAIVMRIMDGIMAIPAILLAIALMTFSNPGIMAVIVAIAVPEVPRVVRLVRSLVLRLREEPFVEASVASGTPTRLILLRHILPNTTGPLAVQMTFVAVSAILLEAALSFLGIGIPGDVPSWGNIIADGRQWFRLTPHVILFPGFFVVVTALGINLLGEGLRAAMDPTQARQA